MKVKSLCIVLLMLLLLLPCGMQGQDAGFRAERFGIRRCGDSVRVSFRVYALHLKSDYRIDLTPVVYSDTLWVSLPPARLSGKRNGRLQRRERIFPGGGLFARKGSDKGKDEDKAQAKPRELSEAAANDTLYYTDTFPYEPWMSSVCLRIDGRLTGCCGSQAMASLQVAADIPLCPPQVEVPATVVATPPASPEPELPESVLSPAQELALHERFIRPAEEYIADRRKGMYHRDPDGLRIYFRLNRRDIDTTYMDNGATLRRLGHALSVVRADSSVRVSALLIAGYASIEGNSALNSRLAGARADALKAFATARGIDPAQVETVNMGEGWDELRDLAARADSLPYREEVLRIIDTVPVLRGREKRLMELRGGVPYRWMAKHLFPQQRNAGYIRLYYTETAKAPDAGTGKRTPDAGTGKKAPDGAPKE